MARERWFYAQDMRRMGPLPKRQLLELLLGLPDPRGCLIWRHGLPAWTPAREVPEIDQQLAPFVKAEPERGLDRGPASTAGERTADRASARTAKRPADVTAARRQPNVALYFGGLGGLLVVVVVGWLFWRASGDGEREEAGGGPGSRSRGQLVDSGGAVAERPAEGSARSAGDARAAGDQGQRGGDATAFTGWSDEEAELNPDQLPRLRGVGGWSGSTLTITLYNGSTWRITEILVRTSRLSGDEFVDGETPHRLLPAGGEPVDAGMAELLKKVAPDRKKAGINPLDTGAFEAAVGPKPEAFRWRIEGARGYPPRG
jgi:uncharacterized protein DUF4339